MDISYKDKCSEKSVKYISCLLWWLEDGPKWKIVYSERKYVFGIFDQTLGPSKFHFCLRKHPKPAKLLRLGKKWKQKNAAWDIANNRYVDLFFKKSFKKRKNVHRYSIGVKTGVLLIADKVYRATFKKSVEEKKVIEMTSDEDEMLLKKSATNPLLGQKWHFLGLGKRP